ncbi:MAG: TetR/AcrR family transcriptional regulator C-terminal domain-containing protein [Eggerthellaceae bacterium]
MGTFDTKLLIAQALVDLCAEQPLKKVSISDIVEKTGKNRKTFYYHFEDKNALIIWKFRYDLGIELQHRFPENILVYEKEGEGKLPELPYYITQKSGVRSLDHSKFFATFAIILERERDFYAQAFAEQGPSALRNYLYELYLPALRNDIYIILANRYLPEENIDFLSEFYTGAFLAYFIRKCEQPGNKRIITDAGPFANIIHSSLESEIKEAQLRRNL